VYETANIDIIFVFISHILRSKI